MHQQSVRSLILYLFLWAFLLPGPVDCQQRNSPFSQIDSWDTPKRVDTPQALNTDLDMDELHKPGTESPSSLNAEQQAIGQKNHYADPDRQRRLYHHEMNSKTVEGDRRRVRKAREDYEKQNKSDKEYYDSRCGLGNRHLSRGSCRRLKKRLSNAKDSRKKALSQKRREIRKRR